MCNRVAIRLRGLSGRVDTEEMGYEDCIELGEDEEVWVIGDGESVVGDRASGRGSLDGDLEAEWEGMKAARGVSAM